LCALRKKWQFDEPLIEALKLQWSPPIASKPIGAQLILGYLYFVTFFCLFFSSSVHTFLSILDLRRKWQLDERLIAQQKLPQSPLRHYLYSWHSKKKPLLTWNFYKFLSKILKNQHLISIVRFEKKMAIWWAFDRGSKSTLKPPDCH